MLNVVIDAPSGAGDLLRHVLADGALAVIDCGPGGACDLSRFVGTSVLADRLADTVLGEVDGAGGHVGRLAGIRCEVSAVVQVALVDDGPWLCQRHAWPCRRESCRSTSLGEGGGDWGVVAVLGGSAALEDDKGVTALLCGEGGGHDEQCQDQEGHIPAVYLHGGVEVGQSSGGRSRGGTLDTTVVWQLFLITTEAGWLLMFLKCS